MDWIALQLADASFPTGGFVHSGGLEQWLAMNGGRGQTLRWVVSAFYSSTVTTGAYVGSTDGSGNASGVTVRAPMAPSIPSRTRSATRKALWRRR